ncbi:hypothetical protein [Nocardia sp. NPDC051750]|uniref:hypothetical protein n=1 Tax=Nocardia sp. NPDC051750 TaxID=3364325 RepID=UPI0037A5287E
MVAGEWVPVVRCRNVSGGMPPRLAFAAWLRERGIDWMPFAADEVVINPMRVQESDGRMGCVVEFCVLATALRRLGLHPDQTPG